MKRIALGIGIVLIMFAVSSAEAYPIPPGKDAVVYFDPDPSSGPNGEDVTVQLRVNSSVGLCGYADWIYFDPSCVDITDVDYSGSPFSEGTSWISFGDFIKVHGMDPSYCEPAGDHLLCTLTLQCKSDGVCTSQLIHNMDHEEIYDCDLEVPDTLWAHGNFSCEVEPVIFEKELVLGWNLISLPLEPEDDSSTSAVLSSISGNYSAVFRYDSTAKEFEVVTDGTMDPGIGYFVNVTTAGTWSYTGRHTPISVDLKPGLNCIGWGNTSEGISDALSPISGNYTYVAKWGANDLEYEVYDANAPEGISEFIDFETMERGNGYWIAAKDGYTLNV